MVHLTKGDLSMNQEGLTTRQAIMWFTMYQIGTSFLLLPSYLVDAAKQDAWMAIILGVGIQMLIIWLYLAIAQQMKGKSMIAYFQHLFGRTLGSIFIFLYLIAVPFLNSTTVLRSFGDFMTTSIMPETPIHVFYLFLLIPIYFVIRSGISVIGRTAELFFFAFVLIFVTVCLTLIPSVNPHYLLPLLENGWKPVVHSTTQFLAYPFLEGFFLLFLLPYYQQQDKLKRIFITSTLLTGFLFLVMMVSVITVLSPGAIKHLTYPSYFVVRTLSIADFIERFEIPVTVFWHITIFYRLTLFLYITIDGLRELFKLKDNRSILIPIFLITITLSNWIWPNYTTQLEMLSSWYLYMIIIGILIPVLLLIIGMVRPTTK
jgi:spore germination protein KB